MTDNSRMVCEVSLDDDRRLMECESNAGLDEQVRLIAWVAVNGGKDVEHPCPLHLHRIYTYISIHTNKQN